MTPFLIWLVRLLVLILVIRFLMRSVTALTSGRRAASRPARVPERLGGTLVRDPHCGTYVPKANALAVGSGADVQHFCSAACRDAWLSADARARVKA